MKSLSRRFVLRFGMLGLALATPGCEERRELTVFVVRHAEKAKPADGAAAARDPELSALGKKRAAALPLAVGDAPLRAIYSTRYRRTQATVAPAARAAGLEVQTADANDSAALAKRIAGHDAGAILVVGHSNTVPEIIAALGVVAKIQLGDDDYGDLFVVRLVGSKASLERRRFGD